MEARREKSLASILSPAGAEYSAFFRNFGLWVGARTALRAVLASCFPFAVAFGEDCLG
jgi:hypothetical protein